MTLHYLYHTVLSDSLLDLNHLQRETNSIFNCFISLSTSVPIIKKTLIICTHNGRSNLKRANIIRRNNKRRCPKIEHYGTPHSTGLVSDFIPS